MSYRDGVHPSPAPPDHLVLTRFSAVLAHGAPPPSQDWLDYRLGFFIDACLPSLQSQTCKDFTWLVWFDDRCRDDFRRDVEELATDTFVPVWTHSPFQTSLMSEIATHAQAPFLITTRLDSDDAVARTFIERIQHEARSAGEVDRLVVDFPVGLQVDRTGSVYADHLQSNHFVSLVERRVAARPVTVFADAHPKLRRHAPIRRVMTEPMWLEVVHGSNVSNSVRGLQTDPSVIAKHFDIHLTYRTDISPRELRHSQYLQAARLLRQRATDPHAALSWWRSVRDRARGSQDLPRRTSPTLGERLQARWHR